MSDEAFVIACEFEGTDFLDFSDNMPHESPATPFRRNPDKSFIRDFFSDKVKLPNGSELEFWGFDDGSGRHELPSPTIRVTEGDIVHVLMKAGKGPHTIHHHGIEPDSVNDGVGHTSFEAGEYTYQFQPYTADGGRAARATNPDPTTGRAGSYAYHCHVNTVLHAQMPLAGLLIVDPEETNGTNGQMRRPFHNCRFTYFADRGQHGPPAHERYWATYAADPRWRELEHAAGLDGKDVGLNIFRPTVFTINGSPETGTADSPTRKEPVAILNVDLNRLGTLAAFEGATAINPAPVILVRLINFAYMPQIVDFGDAVQLGTLRGKIIASDGTPFRPTKTDSAGRPTVDLSDPNARHEIDLNALTTGRMQLSAFERFDVVLFPTKGNTVFPITWEFRHWISNRLLGKVQTIIKTS